MNKKNPLVIYLFTIIGSSLRYVLFYLFYLFKGEKPKPFLHFSSGFNQIASNLLITLFLFILMMTLLLFFL